jgi:ElaB/YqjD/DUF883 family membrane-anchored ribosome-binding protein
MADGSVGEAQDKAQEVAGEAQEKARDSVRQQVDQRSTEAGERVAGTAKDMRSVGEELRKQGKDAPAKLADRAAEETEKVGSYLKEKGPDEMLHDAEEFGRQRPWAVLAGGLALGVVAARFLKASSRNRYQQRSNGAQTNGQVPQRTTPPPVNRSAVEPVVTPLPPTATPNPTAMPVTPRPSASPAP